MEQFTSTNGNHNLQVCNCVGLLEISTKYEKFMFTT